MQKNRRAAGVMAAVLALGAGEPLSAQEVFVLPPLYAPAPSDSAPSAPVAGATKGPATVVSQPCVEHGIILLSEEKQEKTSVNNRPEVTTAAASQPEAMPSPGTSGVVTVIVPEELANAASQPKAASPAKTKDKPTAAEISEPPSLRSRLSRYIVRSCNLDPGKVRVAVKSPVELDVFLQAASETEAQTLSRQILNLPNLLIYRVNLHVQLPTKPNPAGQVEPQPPSS